MKNIFRLALLCALVLCLCACGTEEQQKDPSPGKEWTHGLGEGSAAEEETKYYPHNMENDLGSQLFWNDDNTLTFQNGHSLLTVNGENELVREVTLSQVPEACENTALYRGGKYILAISRDFDNYKNGVFYYTYNGKVCLANVALYDENGGYIKDFPTAKISEKTGTYGLPVDKNDFVMATRPAHPEAIFWIDETRAYITFYYAVGIFDFESGEGKILFDARKYRDENGFKTVDMERAVICGGKLYFYITEYGEENLNKMFCVDGEEVTDQGVWRAIYSDGENLIFGRDDEIHAKTNKLYPQTKRIGYADYPTNFHSYEGRISFEEYTEYGEESFFYSYDTAKDEMNVFKTGIESSVGFIGAKKVNGMFEYYFSAFNGESGEEIWRYEESTGYYTKLLGEIRYNKKVKDVILSPNLELYAEETEVDGQYFVRVCKLPAGGAAKLEAQPEFPKEPEYTENPQNHWVLKTEWEYSPEEIEIFLLNYGPRYGYTEKDLYRDAELQQKFDKEYKTLQYWLSLTAEQLDAAASQKIEGENSTAVYCLFNSEVDYGPNYYIWHNALTGESKFLTLNEYCVESDTLVNGNFIVNKRTCFETYSMESGEEAESPVNFDFGYQTESMENKGRITGERVALGIAYDEEQGKYIVPYHDWFLRDCDNSKARVKLAVFEKDGTHIKNIDTGADIYFINKDFYVYSGLTEFYEKGKVRLQFPHGMDPQWVECSYLSAPAEQPKDETEQLWDKFAGTWAIVDENYMSIVRFFECEGELYITRNLNHGKVDYFTGKATGFEKVGDTLWLIKAKNDNGEFALYIDSGKPGDSILSAYKQGEDPMEFTFYE